MTYEPPKERKFVECFKSNKDGSCNYCKTRSWRIGNKIYAMKKCGKWLACSDRKCYLEQGGTLTVYKDKIYLIDDAPLITFVNADLIVSDTDELRIRFEGSNTDYLVETKKIEKLFAMIATKKEAIR